MLSILVILVLLAPCHCSLETPLAQEPTTMPNIGALFKGYDIMYGNPVPTNGLPVDPGYRQPIFNSNYSMGSLTPDQRYKQPDGTSISSCSGTCSLGFASQELAGTQSYQNSLEVKASIDGGGWGAKFSASADYKEVAQGSSAKKMVYTHSEATCCAYQAKILTYTPPALHPDFLAGMSMLPADWDADAYNKFIDTFGTHYVTAVSMGALFGQQTSFESTAWSQMVSDGLKISAAASYSGFGVAVAGDMETDEQKQMARSFSSKASEQREYSMGAKPPADGKAQTWVQSTIESPAPMSVKLAQLDTLLDKATPSLSHSARLAVVERGADTIKANLQRAIYEYCERLMNASVVTSCMPPGSDPPFPMASFPVDQMKQFTSTLAGVVPESENTDEWMQVRAVSGEVHDMVTETNFPDKMKELLWIFSRISPESSNRNEWQAIRDKSGALSSSTPLDAVLGHHAKYLKHGRVAQNPLDV